MEFGLRRLSADLLTLVVSHFVELPVGVCKETMSVHQVLVEASEVNRFVGKSKAPFPIHAVIDHVPS